MLQQLGMCDPSLGNQLPYQVCWSLTKASVFVLRDERERGAGDSDHGEELQVMSSGPHQ